MELEVKLYGSARSLVGSKCVTLKLPDAPTVEGLVRGLLREHPALVAGEQEAIIFVNGHEASPGQALKEGDDVRLVPAVAGGLF